MSHSHHHGRAHHVVAAEPTFSLLRLSVLERLMGAGLALGGLWLLVFLVLG